MNIRTILASAAVIVGATIVAAPAHAEEPVVCDAACVDAYEQQIDQLTTERDWLAFKLQVANSATAAAESKLAATELSRQYAVSSALRYKARYEFWHNKALVRRATIIELRHELRDRV
jgi:hypothetical protein